MRKGEQINPYSVAKAKPAWALTRHEFFNLMTVKIWIGGETKLNKRTGERIHSPHVPVYKVVGRPKELSIWQVAWDRCGRIHFDTIRAQIERSHSLNYLSADNFIEYATQWKSLISSEAWANFKRDGS